MVSYDGCGFQVRQDLVDSQKHAYQRISMAGTWLDGDRRTAVAKEVRNARTCPHCQAQKSALSPNSVDGEHAGLGALNSAEVDVIHRIVSDPGRLSEQWYQSNVGDVLSPEEFIEIVSIVAIMMIIDTFTFGLGLPDHPLLSPEAGEPSRYISPGARKDAAWIPITEPEDVSESDGPLYSNPKVGYIQRALSAVPDSKRDYWGVTDTHYLPGPMVYQFDTDFRAISRPQIEVIAARVSALHQCLY